MKSLAPENFKRLRVAAGFKKLAPAARAARINRKTLIYLEQEGMRQDPTHRVLSALAAIYRCKIDDFYSEETAPSPSAPA